ncbi:aspartyl/asparaginyl beta-hydroxylase domain-containing protein [Novosphingobium sp.]|uniref:aspartyl/asparaginyl beta-hydroxylase domain-containing protein n=1 Tax=Novosphingobium sp. TaxID=1874826 RepID=UPI00262DA899|nr:aspartyl/asparaginyl beta-hydroxylase domain-containing protein [Novosphingobium sp.]
MTSQPIDRARAQAANARAMAALRAGDAPAAILAAHEAAHADPGALSLWINLALACRLGGDAAGERAALERALDLDRLDFTAQLRMAQLLQREGEETKALVAWDGVRQLAQHFPGLPEPVRAELAVGEAYCEALRARLAAAARASLAAVQDGLDETERRRIGAFTGIALGERRIYHNECAGLHYPFLPADEFFDAGHFPWFAALEAGASAIRAELEALLAEPGEVIRPYVRMEPGSPENKWTPLDGSLDWSACFLWEYGVPNAAVIERCPETARILESLPLARIPGRAPNAFFSVLRPRSHIPAHTGVTNTRAIIHLALDVPPGCGFRVGGETREWVEGKAFAFDDTIEHEAWNTSDARRAVLIIDAWNPHLSERERAAITAYFAASDTALG